MKHSFTGCNQKKVNKDNIDLPSQSRITQKPQRTRGKQETEQSKTKEQMSDNGVGCEPLSNSK